jgi:hypothetical protein
MNGKPGDHPFTGITTYKLDIYSRRAASLVSRIDRLADDKTPRGLADLLLNDYGTLSNPNVEKLEQILLEMRDRLLADASAVLISKIFDHAARGLIALSLSPIARFLSINS